MKNPVVFAAVFLILAFRVAAEDGDAGGYGAEFKARQAHEKATSDIIYQNEEWKAMYYQNAQMIELLKDIRDSLQILKERSDLKPSEDKTA